MRACRAAFPRAPSLTLQPDRRQGAAHETFFPRTLNAVVICHNPIIFLRSLSAAADRLPLSRTGSSGRHMESLHESGWRKNSRTQASPRPCPLNCFRPSGAERQYQPCTASYALETVAPQEVFRSSFGGYAVKSNTKGRLYIAPPPRLGTHCKQPACLPSVPYKPPVSITRHGALCLLSTSGQIFRDRHQHRRPPVAPHAAMCGKRGLVTCCVRGRTRNVRFSKGHPPCRKRIEDRRVRWGFLKAIRLAEGPVAFSLAH